MICHNCGAPIPDNVTYCPVCGTTVRQAAPQMTQTAFAPVGPTEEKKMDMRSQHLLSLFCGLITLILVSAAMYMFTGMFGNAAVTGTGANTISLFISAVFYVGIALVLGFAANKQNDERKTNSAAMLVFSILQFLLIVFLLFGLLRILIGRFLPDEAYSYAFNGARHLGISVLIGTIGAVIIRLFVDRLSLKMMIIIDAVMLGVSIGLMALMIYVLHYGISLMYWGIGLTQALAVFLPCIGKWNETSYVNANTYAAGYTAPGYAANGQMSQNYPGGQYYSQAQSSPGGQFSMPQMFCPNCGARFPGEKKFCDQCGTQLSVLRIPEGQMQGQMMAPGGAAPWNPVDAPSGGYAALGFFIPLAGLILFLTWHETYPLKARSAGKGALAGVITSVVLGILLIILEAALMSGAFF